MAGWPVGAAYMPPGTFAAAQAPRAAYMRPLQTVPKNDVYGWPVGEAFMPPGTFTAAETPRAAYMRPLQTIPKNGVCGWFVGEAFMPPGTPCAAANTPGGINPSPTHCPQTTACMAGRRGRRHLRRLARKRLPAVTPRAGHARPLQRAAKPPPHFCLCPRAQTPQYLLFIISYLLFAPFVV